MDLVERIVALLDGIVWGGLRVGEESIPIAVIGLLGTGVFLTFRLRFIQIRRLAHGFVVASGKYDDPSHPGDVSHFQALSTALSATVGIGNIAGVAIAIHYGGPGALFWMWVTAFLGMATKYSEVTLAQHYRAVTADADAARWEGSVSGGPMYYIERGLGRRWKPLAVLFAVLLGITAFFTGNAIQANTLADTMRATLGVPAWATGVFSSTLVFLVIVGGITRIGAVTGVLSPLMASVYVGGALLVVVLNAGQVLPTLLLILREAFNPTAGVAGTGIGAILVTMMWGVRRGLFSNEAGQGSAPIAHAAAKTDEPASEGVVALLEPFIDTIVICTLTGLVVIMTGVWNEKHPTELVLGSGDIGWVAASPEGRINRSAAPPAEYRVENGVPTAGPGASRFAWHNVSVDEFFTDREQTRRFTGVIRPSQRDAIDDTGARVAVLFGNAVETGAPLTQLGFERGLQPISSQLGVFIVFAGVLLFAISTAISWSYYGDRCAHYLFGRAAVRPYRVVYVLMHFAGAVAPLGAIWALGDVFLGVVIYPNLLALVLLSPKVVELTNHYFTQMEQRRGGVERVR